MRTHTPSNRRTIETDARNRRPWPAVTRRGWCRTAMLLAAAAAIGAPGQAALAASAADIDAKSDRALKGLLGVTLFFLLANLATDMVYGAQAERPEWMVKSRTYPLLNASGRAIVDWVEARRKHPREPSE